MMKDPLGRLMVSYCKHCGIDVRDHGGTSRPSLRQHEAACARVQRVDFMRGSLESAAKAAAVAPMTVKRARQWEMARRHREQQERKVNVAAGVVQTQPTTP